MTVDNKVLIVEDQSGDIRWLLDLLESLGYDVDLDANEDAARRRLDSIKKGKASYALAIFDVMVATNDIMDLVEIDDDFYEESKDTGIRLCRRARKDLGISPEELPIVCLSARDDEELIDALRELDIPLFSRTPQTPEESLREYLKKNLPRIEPDAKT